MKLVNVEAINNEIKLYVEELNEQIEYLLSNDPQDEFSGDLLIDIASSLKKLGANKDQLINQGEK